MLGVYEGGFTVCCRTSVAAHSIVTTNTVSRYFKIPLGGMCAKSPAIENHYLRVRRWPEYSLVNSGGFSRILCR